MIDVIRRNIAQSVMEMYDSLHQAIQAAGGSGEGFSAKELKDMRVSQLIGDLANNGIRFYWDNPKKVDDEYV